ncbi:MAG: response regulator transcription factor [Deltaproteobacteria bacterium]|nr:response regulator transcription factor [Deltaproteobacteria bacterium]
MNKPERIVLAEDHTIVRKGLRTLLSKHAGFAIVGEAADGREAIRSVDELKPDLILIDLTMPKMDGTLAIQEIKRRSPHTKVLVLTMHNTEDTVLAALEAGADGYLLKDDTHGELLIAIDSVLKGKFYLSPAISGKVVKGYLEGKKKTKGISPWDSLTQREKEVLKLIAEAYSNKEIAEQLFVSVKTVEKHRANLREKLDLHNTSALTKYAIEKGLVKE